MTPEVQSIVLEVQSVVLKEGRRRCAARLGLFATALLAATSPAAAQLTTTSTTSATSVTSPITTPTVPSCVQEVKTRLVEWDINPKEDVVAGALTVDDRSSSRQSKLWFVTRNGQVRVYRLTPGRNIKKDYATARSWPLVDDNSDGQTGGVRLRHSDDGRFVFVNINRIPNATNIDPTAGLVAVDTRDNLRITWNDRPYNPLIPHMSDVSVDTRGGGYSVFTAAPTYLSSTGPVGVDGVVQRLSPLQPQLKDGKWVVPAEVTRWEVGGGAGTCEDTGPGVPCIPGVVVDRRHGQAIYVSQPTFVNRDGTVGAIGEIDPRPIKCPDNPYAMCVKVRHWPLPVGTGGPRQILVDDTGRVWGITSSGHLFSLSIDRSSGKGNVTRHDPIGGTEDFFAVAPDGGTIGFTDTAENQVSVLLPDKDPKPVVPKISYVKPKMDKIFGQRQAAPYADHSVQPRTAEAPGLAYTVANDGTYVETDVSTNLESTGSPVPSTNPTGMVPDGARKTGSFYYGVQFGAVADSTTGELTFTNRVGQLDLKVDPQKETDYRKDDDDYDDDGEDDEYDRDDDEDGYSDEVDDDDDNDCIPDHMDRDKDNDGVEDEHDSKSHRENKRTDRGSMGPGESKGYEVESDSNSVAMLAIVEAASLTTPLSIEIVDPNGVVVLSTPPVLGKAVATATPALPGVYTVRVKNGGASSTTYKTTVISKSIWF